MPSAEKNRAAETVALQYLMQLEDGTAPALADFEVRLDNEADRSELRELIAAARWARTRYPAPFRSEVLIDGRYRLIRQIGTGGYGKVWLAEDTRLSRDVALKIVTALGDAAAAAKSIRNEVATLGRLSHRGIVRLYDSGTHDGSCYVAMEFVAGKSLAELLDLLGTGSKDSLAVRRALDCPVPPGETVQFTDDWQRFAVGVVVDLLWALGAAHGNGVVHRDLKPANVMLTGSGRPILLDFGLAGLRDGVSGTITKGLFGTTPYLAPEQLAAERSGKALAIDVYQAGLILYELLTGQRAFAASLHEGLVRKILDGEFEKPRARRKDLPQPLEDIVLRAMARSPGQRYASVDAFRTDLECWLEGVQPAASAGGAAMRVVRETRELAFRRRRFLGLAAALVLGALPVYLLRPQPPLLQNFEILADGRVGFDLGSAASVIPIAVWADSTDAIVGYQPARVGDAAASQQMVRLDSGRHSLRVAVQHDSPYPPAGARMVIVLRATKNAAEAATWLKFQEMVEDRVVDAERPLKHTEMAELQKEATDPGRGLATLPGFDLAGLVGDGTLAGFEVKVPKVQ